jgi:DNA invertase Pin-like site-specific DNA recombinase
MAKTTAKTFAYIRVSTKEQNTDRQLDELKKYVKSDRDMFIDKASGKDFNRPNYQAMKATLRSGDTVYIKSLDRLGRNKQAIKEELEYFKHEGIIIRCLDIPTTLIDLSAYGDMQRAIFDMINNILIEVLGTMAEQERKNIRERQAEGIKAALARGKKFGRTKIAIDDTFKSAYTEWKQGKLTARAAMAKCNMKANTWYRRVAEYEQ